MAKKGRPAKVNNAGILISAYYNEGSITKACDKLNITRRTFYETMKRLNLKFTKRIG